MPTDREFIGSRLTHIVVASLTTLTWDQVRNAGTFRDAINRFDSFAQEHLLPKNLEFAFVTLDSWDLRVQLPREARDKAVVLPPYLQHSRTFDLRTEYQRWQAHQRSGSNPSPEAQPGGSVNTVGSDKGTIDSGDTVVASESTVMTRILKINWRNLICFCAESALTAVHAKPLTA